MTTLLANPQLIMMVFPLLMFVVPLVLEAVAILLANPLLLLLGGLALYYVPGPQRVRVLALLAIWLFMLSGKSQSPSVSML